MSGIAFRGRKNHELFDAGFYLHGGDTLNWHVGDTVAVCFPDQKELISQVIEFCPHGFQFHGPGDFLQVICVVVKRSHSVVWKKIGQLDSLVSCSVVLEADSGHWEDVLRYVVLGQKPEWIEYPQRQCENPNERKAIDQLERANDTLGLKN